MGMAKFADIEPFYDWLVELMRMDTSSYPDHETLMFYEIIDKLDSLPEVVRCKDCRKCRIYDDVITGQKQYECSLWHGATREVSADSFCDAGERREGE